MTDKRNANIQMICPWLSKFNGLCSECIKERCPYYDLDPKVILRQDSRPETYYLQSCTRVHQQSVELEIVANIFRELRNLLKEETK